MVTVTEWKDMTPKEREKLRGMMQVFFQDMDVSVEVSQRMAEASLSAINAFFITRGYGPREV